MASSLPTWLLAVSSASCCIFSTQCISHHQLHCFDCCVLHVGQHLLCKVLTVAVYSVMNIVISCSLFLLQYGLVTISVCCKQLLCYHIHSHPLWFHNPFAVILYMYQLSLMTCATELCSRLNLSITVINYTGRASELGCIVNLDDWSRSSLSTLLSIHLCWTKFITYFNYWFIVAKFLKSQVYDKVPEGSTFIFVDIWISLKH